MGASVRGHLDCVDRLLQCAGIDLYVQNRVNKKKNKHCTKKLRQKGRCVYVVGGGQGGKELGWGEEGGITYCIFFFVPVREKQKYMCLYDIYNNHTAYFFHSG